MQARAHAKYKILMEAAPDATIDCGDLLQPQRLFDVLDCAVAKLAGSAEFIFENFICCDAQSAARAWFTSYLPESGSPPSRIRMCCDGLRFQHASSLLLLLSKFPALKHVDVSHNPELMILPLGMLRFAASLSSFSCDECCLLLPPQLLFSSEARKNPARIQQFLDRGVPDIQSIDLSSLALTPADASEVAALLCYVTSLESLDLSDNPGINSSAAFDVVNSLAGEIRGSLSLHYCALMLLAGAPCFRELNLSGSSIENLPENMMKQTPNLKVLKLSRCSWLCSLPVSLYSLSEIDIQPHEECVSLIYPPKSFRVSSEKCISFLRQVHENSVIWRRIKVRTIATSSSLWAAA